MPRHPLRPSARSRDRATALGLVSAGASVAFGLLTAASARRLTASVDRTVGPRIAAPGRHPLRRAAQASAPLGKWYVLVPAGLAVSAYLARGRGPRRKGVAAASVAAATVLAALLEPAFDHLLPQPPVPRGRSKRKPVFPSGHAFLPTAVALTSAYALVHQEEVDARPAYAVAIAVPALLAGAKLVAEEHWLSDVVAGWLGGVAVAAGCAAVLERS